MATAGAVAQETYDYEIKIGQFSRIKLVNNVNVVYSANPDSTGYAYFNAPKSLADLFLLSVNNGELKIETLPQDLGTTGLPTLYVYSDFLESVRNDSDSTLTVRQADPCPRFKVTLVGNGRIVADNLHCSEIDASLNTGNGTIVLSGQCNTAKFRMVGTGLIQADDLKADYVSCSILGGGTIGCWPRFELKSKGIGSTKIYYKGNPELKKRGGGKLLKLDTYVDSDDYIENR